MKIKELRELRAKHVADARAILDTAEKEKREPTAEQRGQFDTLMGEADKCEARFKELERLEAAERSVNESQGRQTDREQPGRVPGTPETRTDPRATEEYRAAYAHYLLTGESRGLVADNDAGGGYLLPPQQMVNDLIKKIDDIVSIRKFATKFSVPSAQSLGVPTLDNDPADADWTSELLTGSEDTTMSVGKRELHPHPIAKLEKVSNKLLRMVPAEALVNERLAYKFGVTEEKGFLTGDGAGKPLGLFTASDNGISTARDVSTDNSTSAFTADGLLNAKYSLKEPYRRSGSLRWVMHRDAVKMARKLKDGNGQYLWSIGLGGQPDTLLDVQVIESEYAPNTFTTAKYVALIGDLSRYYIADALNFSVQRLVELLALTNQVGFIGRLEVDGMPVLEEAFARVKLA